MMKLSAQSESLIEELIQTAQNWGSNMYQNRNSFERKQYQQDLAEAKQALEKHVADLELQAAWANYE